MKLFERKARALAEQIAAGLDTSRAGFGGPVDDEALRLALVGAYERGRMVGRIASEEQPCICGPEVIGCRPECASCRDDGCPRFVLIASNCIFVNPRHPPK